MAANQLSAPVIVEGLSQLAERVPQVTDLFCEWKEESSRIRVLKCKKQILHLKSLLDDTCKDYVVAVEKAAEESRIGANVARQTIDLIDQLLEGDREPETIQDLREDLLGRIQRALGAAKQLGEEFRNVRRNLLVANGSLPELRKEIQDYSTAPVSANAKLLAAVSIFLTPVWSKARDLRDAANAETRTSTAQVALTVLENIKPGLDQAITVVGTLVDFWTQLHESISATESGRLLEMKTAVLRLQKKRWADIYRHYDVYAKEADKSRTKLEAKSDFMAISDGRTGRSTAR